VGWPANSRSKQHRQSPVALQGWIAAAIVQLTSADATLLLFISLIAGHHCVMARAVGVVAQLGCAPEHPLTAQQTLTPAVLHAMCCAQGTKVNSKGKEVPHGVRLYSIASSRYGDGYDGKTTTLCVRRAVYNDPETGKEDPAKKGICSNFLCDAKPGDEINMTGEPGRRRALGGRGALDTMDRDNVIVSAELCLGGVQKQKPVDVWRDKPAATHFLLRTTFCFILNVQPRDQARIVGGICNGCFSVWCHCHTQHAVCVPSPN
jgi:hypothetical protein